MQLFQFFDILSRHFEKYLLTMKLTEHVWVIIFFCISKKKPGEIPISSYRYSELLWRNFEFSPIFHEISQFLGSAMPCDVITT